MFLVYASHTPPARPSTAIAFCQVGDSAAADAAAAAAAAPHVGEYQCESCSSLDTSFDIIGGAAVGTRKAETFGKKDAPELILRVVCHACGNNWLEER